MSASYQAVPHPDPEANAGSGHSIEMVEAAAASGGRDRAMTFSPAAPDNSPTVLTFSNISVSTKTTPKKVLLNDVSGSVTGGFWAIMGASGSGKTTLLSTLSLRVDTSFMDITGEFRLNGREYTRADLKAMSAYLMQDDLMFADLTVQETLFYAAELRMTANTKSREARLQRCDQCLDLLEISHCKNTIIGSSRRKGISGGERKRVAVAIEMLNHPKLMFMDGPTNGLDSTTAFTVSKVFKKMTELGECTIVCTIEQPSPRVFRLFDNLILLKKGEIVYIGHSMKSVKFLEMIGKPCPTDVNLADHLVNILIEGNAEDKDQMSIAEAEKGVKRVPINLELGMEKPFFSNEGAKNWFHEFYILFLRSLQNYLRRTDIILLNFVATIIIAVFISFGAWFQIGNGQQDIKTFLPPLFFVVVNQGVVGSLQTVTCFPAERAIMLRERASGCYQVSSYFCAKTVVDFISCFWAPIVLAIIVYFSIGYENTAESFFIYMFFLILTAIAATSLATAIVCTCVSIERSIVVLSFMFEVSRLFGGYYTSPKLLDDYPDWRFADALSYTKYAYVGLSLNFLQDLKVECDTGKTCLINSGEDIIKNLGYDEYTIGACFGYLIVLIVGFRLIGYLGLRFLK